MPPNLLSNKVCTQGSHTANLAKLGHLELKLLRGHCFFPFSAPMTLTFNVGTTNTAGSPYMESKQQD